MDEEGQGQCYQERARTSGMNVHSELVHRAGEPEQTKSSDAHSGMNGEDFFGIQRLKAHVHNAGGAGSTPGQGAPTCWRENLSCKTLMLLA